MIKAIDKNLKEAHKVGHISDNDLKSITAKEKGPSKFYQLFKVHKTHAHPELPHLNLTTIKHHFLYPIWTFKA